MSHDHGTPPSDWPSLETASMTRLTDDIYYGWLDHETNPIFWHWCAALADVPEEHTTSGQWVAAGTGAHTLISREPLHLEPSLLRCARLRPRRHVEASVNEQPIGPILDGLGATIDLEEGDLVASALVIAKVVDAQGGVSLTFSSSEGLSWVDQNGLLASAQMIVNQSPIGRKDDDE